MTSYRFLAATLQFWCYLSRNQETLEVIGLGSRSSAKKAIKEIESLRNNLSHAQDIVTYDWAQIVRITQRLQESF